MTLAPGARLGTYEVIALIGAGGMGEVYRAHDTRLKRDVALKVLPAKFSRDPDRLARFQREAELLARLNHPNIAAVYGIEQADGVTAIVLELVEGQMLASMIAHGSLAHGDALSIARQMAGALEAAHAKGVIHRDLKPANVKVTTEGRVKVLDFGLARTLEPASLPISAESSDSTTISGPAAMTADGVILGTPLYMSPEQARGQVVDKQSDIWAFGCVVYEMLTQKNPFAGSTISDTIAFILTKEPDWTALPVTTPSSIRRLLRRCLMKAKEQRLSDIGDARFEIDEARAPSSADSLAPARTGASPPTDDRKTYVTAPPLPVNYVARPEAIEALRTVLIGGGGARHVALTALEGMGGIGKTVLAQALCHDPLVHQAFPDGVIWITIGKEPVNDLVAQMREVGKAFHDDLAAYDNELGSINQYRSIFRDKGALIVLDDVWHVHDVEPFCAESSRSRLLFTTRDASIGAAVGAREHPADLLTDAQSREVLARWSGRREDDLPSQADDLIAECGRLPLALSMVGAMLRGKPLAFWRGVLDLLRGADLEKIRVAFPNYAHLSLFRAIQVSVDELAPVARRRYLALAVLLEDMVASPPILRCLWGTDEFETLETAELFVSLSLAQRSGDEGAIQLHDLQLDYVRASFADREVLPLIHSALRLGAHAFGEDPTQFASQVTGRLLMHQGQPLISRFLGSLSEAAPRPWLRPLRPILTQAGGACVRILKGHSDSVFYLTLSADGRRAVSLSADGTLKVWNVDTGRHFSYSLQESLKLAVTQDGRFDLSPLAVTPDGRLAVLGTRDGTMKMWEVDTGRVLTTVRSPYSERIAGVAVSANGRRVLFTHSTGQRFLPNRPLHVWEIEKGELRALEGSAQFFSIALSPDGRRAIAGSTDGAVTSWDVDTGHIVRILEGPSAKFEEMRADGLDRHRFGGVVFSADGRRAIAGSSEFLLKIWEVDSGREVHAGEGVLRSAAGQWALGGIVSQFETSETLTVLLWDLNTGRALPLPGVVPGDPMAVSADGRRAVSASEDFTLRVWDLDAARELHGVDTSDAQADAYFTGVAASADGRRALSVFLDGTMKVWDVGTGKEERSLEARLSEGERAFLSPSSFTVGLSGYLKFGCLLFNDTNRLDKEASPVIAAALSADGQRAVSGTPDYGLRVWDIDTGQDYFLKGHSDWVSGVALSADGRRAMSACVDGALKIWELDAARELLTLEHHSGGCGVISVAMSADGRRAVSASTGGLMVWNVDTGLEMYTITVEWDSRLLAGSVGVAMSADGRRVVCSTSDCTLRVWDVETGLELRALGDAFVGVEGPDSICGVALSADGHRAVSCFRGTLKVWDTETGKALATFTCDHRLRCCTLGNSGTILAGEQGGIHAIHVLSLEP
ncbi:MAG: protein kinase [Vicinamibacterales bacterium]